MMERTHVPRCPCTKVFVFHVWPCLELCGECSTAIMAAEWFEFVGWTWPCILGHIVVYKFAKKTLISFCNSLDQKDCCQSIAMLFAFSPVCIPRRVGVGLDLGRGEEAGYLFKLAKRQPRQGDRQAGRQGVKSVMELERKEKKEGGPPPALSWQRRWNKRRVNWSFLACLQTCIGPTPTNFTFMHLQPSLQCIVDWIV